VRLCVAMTITSGCSSPTHSMIVLAA
jgi:hypothetical protein